MPKLWVASLTSILVSLGSVGNVHADYAWIVPNTGVVCTGGDASGPTVGQWLMGAQPQAYALLAPGSQLFLNHVYAGTTCKSHSGAATSPAPWGIPGPNAVGGSTAGVDPSGSSTTGPFQSCPTSQQSPGCVTATAIFNNTINFGSSNYTAEVLLESDICTGITASWAAPAATNFHNNHGQSWGMAITGGVFNYSDHKGYYTDAFGQGNYVWFAASPLDTATNIQSELVHMGYQSTLTINYPGGPGVGSYCWFAEFNFAASTNNGGWCAVA